MDTGVLDDLDRRILSELQEDGRRSYREISQRLGVAAGTVRSRVLQLISDQVVEIIAVPNPWRMGFGFFAALGLRLDTSRVEEVADDLAARQDVTWVGLTATGYDLMIEVALADAQEFGRFRGDVLAKLPGFRSVDVFLLYDMRKLYHRFHFGPTAADQAGRAAGGRTHQRGRSDR